MEGPSPTSDGPTAGKSTTSELQAQSQAAGHKRIPSAGGIFSKFSFSRNPSDPHRQHHHSHSPVSPGDAAEKQGPLFSTSNAPLAQPTPRQPPSIASALQQQKTRRRRGSLRKVALLGRGAQRERREASRASLSIDVRQAESWGGEATGKEEGTSGTFGLGISDITPRPSMDGYAKRNASSAPAVAAASLLAPKTGPETKPKVEIDEPTPTSPTISYTTTDDEDAVLMRHNTSGRAGPELASLSSGSDGFFGRVEALPRRRTTISRARSPLIAATSLLAAEDDWDYSETEWWGWVILVVTWVVFVVGMGSVFGVWNWAWDVGTTPYAPPELEDDPTLPITGYYPCLMILTCVMAWVWVVSAWVGMKYFRHAKISGD